MDNLFELADNLTKTIKESSCYTNYISAKENIKQNPELCKKVREFKKIHMDFQKRKNNGETISFDYEKSVSQKYHSLILNDDIKTFLENEQILLKLIGTVYNRITSECILDFDI